MVKKLNLALLAALILNGLCAAAAPVNPDDFTDTSWILWGNAKFSSKVLSGSAKCFSGVYFDTTGRVHFLDEEGYDISGDYNFDAEGNLVIDVTEQDLENFFDEYLSDTYPFTLLDDWDIDVISVKSSAKVSYTGDRVTLSASISMKANIYLEYDGQSYDCKLSFATKLAGDRPVKNASWASKWSLAGKMKASVKKVKANVPLNLELVIGDYGVSGLDIYQYCPIMVSCFLRPY
jgi:hypothetical protein